MRLCGHSDIRTPVDENPDLGRPRSGDGVSHYLVQCRIGQVLFANLNTVDACPRGVLDEVGETAPELPAFGDGIEQQGAPACNGPVTTIPDAANLSGMANATAAGIALNRPSATNYSLVNLTGLLNVAISVWKWFLGRKPENASDDINEKVLITNDPEQGTDLAVGAMGEVPVVAQRVYSLH